MGLRRISMPYYCNLSPRGDGNFHASLFILLKYIIAIYPREGTETRFDRGIRFSMELQFIPARGRKLPAALSNALGVEIAIYPREGTETCGRFEL